MQKKLTQSQKTTLKKHSKHHSKKHMNEMKKDMKTMHLILYCLGMSKVDLNILN